MGARYRWNGHILYVANVRGRWAAAYDGPCGHERMYVTAGGLEASDSKEEAQRRLDKWAKTENLERVTA